MHMLLITCMLSCLLTCTWNMLPIYSYLCLFFLLFLISPSSKSLFSIYLLSLFSLPLVIQALVALVHDPEPEHPLRGDLAEEFTKNRSAFNKKAEEHTVKYAEKRPA